MEATHEANDDLDLDGGNGIGTEPGQQTEIPGTRPAYFDEIDPLCQAWLNAQAEVKQAEKVRDAKMAAIAEKCGEHDIQKYKYTPPGGKTKLFTCEVENSWRCRNAGKDD